MARHIIQRLLQHTVDMHPGAAIEEERHTLLFIGYGNSGLPFYHRNIPVKHYGMQSLRKTANALQRSLHDLKNFLQIRSQ